MDTSINRAIKVLMVLLVFLPAAANAFAPTRGQAAVLDMAMAAGKKVGWEETVQSIVLVESSAGADSVFGDDGRSIGLMQVQPATAAYVSLLYAWLPVFEHEFVYANALLDRRYNLMVGAAYFKRCMDVFKNWRRAVVCYNTGIAGAKRLTDQQVNNHTYLNKVRKSLQMVREYRRGHQ